VLSRASASASSFTDQSNGLPDAPVTSLAVIASPVVPGQTGALVAAVWGHGVYRTLDGGGSWIPCAGQPGASGSPRVYQLRYHDGSGTLFCSVAGSYDASGGWDTGDAGLWWSDTAGSAWISLTAGAAGIDGRNIVDFDVHPQYGIAAHGTIEKTVYVATQGISGSAGTVYRHLDTGQWQAEAIIPASNPYGTSFDFFSVRMDPRDSDTVWACSPSHGLWLKRSGGTWQEVKLIPFLGVQRIEFEDQSLPATRTNTFVSTFGAGMWRITSASRATWLRWAVMPGSRPSWYGTAVRLADAAQQSVFV
jgi:hypothetical protein